MKDILARAQSEVLAGYAWSNVLIGLDFDGTLAPIVNEPSAAEMRASTRALLIKLAERYPVAVISGRALADVARRFEGVPLRAVIGNHGLEPGGDLARCRATVARWVPRLKEALAAQRGVEIEDKSITLAIHYRRSRARREALAAIRAAIEPLDARAIGGKLVVNVVPDGSPHKGIALLRLRERFDADTALYLGDDVTDEDVFGLDEPGRLLGIRVGRERVSSAPYYVPSQKSVDTLLSRLCELRATGTERRLEQHTP